jgi:hypothetical protein
MKLMTRIWIIEQGSSPFVHLFHQHGVLGALILLWGHGKLQLHCDFVHSLDSLVFDLLQPAEPFPL